MTREGAESVKDALRAISEQCRATNSCENCPLSVFKNCPFRHIPH